MVRFNTIVYSGRSTGAKMAFGTFSGSQNSGDHTSNKNAKTLCSAQICLPRPSMRSQGEYLLYRKAVYLKYYENVDNNRAVKYNLNSGLLTKMNLTNAPVIANIEGTSPTPITTSSIPYLDYTIDPSGNLFGDTVCGINNYLDYRVYNP